MTMSDRDTNSTDCRRDVQFFEGIVETVGVGVGVYGADGRFEHVNDAYADILGADRETIEGRAVWEINPRIDQDRFDTYWASFVEGETRTTETIHEFDGHAVPVQTITTCREINGTSYHFGTVQDISERKEREERFQAFVEQSNDILSILNQDGTFEYQSPSVERILGYDSEEMIGDDGFEYVHPDDREEVRAEFEAAFSDPDAVSVVEYRIQDANGTWRWLESRASYQFNNSTVDGLVINSRDITERKEHERQLAGLHDTTSEMLQATDEQTVCEIAVRTAEEFLGFQIMEIWLSNEGGDQLEPAASTAASEELFGDLPVYTGGNSLSWQAYTTGESLVFDDLRDEPELYDPDTQVRSELILPLGDYGALNAGAIDPHAFTDNDIVLLKLLAENTRIALERFERERELERQSDQMEFFNSILRHDVLNGVTVMKSRAEFLADELEDDQLRDAETIIKWSNDVKDIVRRVQTVLETLTGDDDPQLQPVALGTELHTEISRVESTYPNVRFDTSIPDDVLVMANDLLGDVLGNIITNAIDHNDTNDLRLQITVEKRDELVSVRIEDNGQGIADDRKEVIFRRDETGHAKSTGSGFGLFFVDVMVAEYGGDVWVEDNDDGGATFVIQLPPVN